MRPVHRSPLTRFAALATGAMLLFGGTAMAQTVQVFDDAPSIEQLRAIMIPESRPSASRSIVIQRPDLSTSSTAVQHAVTQPSPAPAPRTRVEAAAVPEASPVMQVATKVPVQQANPVNEAGAVGFHVNFAFNSAVLPDSAREMIDLMAQLMRESPEIKVRVEGHTDAAGPFEYNKALSERRALSVAEYLVKHGVEPSQLSLAGKGPTEPLTQNRYDPANRRVQFVRVS